MVSEIEIPVEFKLIPWKVMFNSAEHRVAQGRTIWKCTRCNSDIEVPVFVRNGFNVVDMMDEDRKIFIGKGKLYICPECFRVIYTSGKCGEFIKINTEHRKKLIEKSADFR